MRRLSPDINRETRQQARDHPGCRLSPIAYAPISLDDHFGMVGTILEGIYVRTNLRRFHVFMQLVHVSFFIKAPRHARLVCHHESEISGRLTAFTASCARIQKGRLLNHRLGAGADNDSLQR